MSGKTVFVTGGAGYIGSHSVVELLNAGYEVIAIDNFTNCVGDEDGTAPSLKRVEKITGKTITFYKCDMLDGARLTKIFKQHHIDCVIHFASMKAVGESMEIPLMYYKNNLIGTINLLEAMESVGCYQLVFSSTCCVYGDPETLPITEDHPTGNVTNVYGRTKYFIEEMLKDLSNSNEKWNIISLRYFNPVGAHPSGLIGEDPTKEFTNLMPYIAQVALKKKPYVTIFGNDYDTVDGTGVRDYIHVMDLASGHVAALKKLLNDHLYYKVYNLGLSKGISVMELIQAFEATTGMTVPVKLGARRFGDVATLICSSDKSYPELDWRPKYDLVRMCKNKYPDALIASDLLTYNLGTGTPVSVQQLVNIFSQVTGQSVAYVVKPRRDGDIVAMYADGQLAKNDLGWECKFSLERMCEDFWRWQTMNPNGYRDENQVSGKSSTNGSSTKNTPEIISSNGNGHSV